MYIPVNEKLEIEMSKKDVNNQIGGTKTNGRPLPIGGILELGLPPVQ